MPLLTTGLIENVAVSGVRPTTRAIVRMTNNTSLAGFVRIQGFYVNGTDKNPYVDETIPLLPGSAVSRDHYAQFDAFEFLFTTSNDGIAVSVWGKNADGSLVGAHRVLPAELSEIDGELSSNFAHIYNTHGQIVPVGSPIAFSHNGVISGDISHTERTAEITLGSAGQYGIWFQVNAEVPNVVTAYRNGSPISGGTFGISTPFAHYPGNLVVSASAHDVITFRNTGLTPMTLQVLTSPVQAATNAGVVIVKLS